MSSLSARIGEFRLRACSCLWPLLAYGQLFVAGDTVRLCQWAAPPVILATLTVLPPRWALAALLPIC